jgi:DNA helicase-2/ATP-dependent DNA helicase PcrA
MALDFEKDLNPEQLKAVKTVAGPCLVLAGAGSGKTRVITYKVAYLVLREHVSPSAIMAVTFTNKAASVLQSRVEDLLDTSVHRRGWWIGTFHSLCGRILREHVQQLGIGYTGRYAVIDEEDRLRLVRQCLKELNLDTKTCEPQKVVTRISDAKSNLRGPDGLGDYSCQDRAAASVYRLYQKYLEQQNLLDFDDLIGLVIRVFNEHPEIEESYGDNFKHVLVDEYQDVNKAQYELVKRLSKGHGSVTVVGDDDQSIYAFRGADPKFILRFEKDYPGTKVVKLEQNYRSTQSILDATNLLVSHNQSPYPKRLQAENAGGEPVVVFQAQDPQGEASFVVSRCQDLVRGGASYRGMAVVYRSNSQSRNLEEVFLMSGVPYRIVKGLRFYERQEVKDVLAYLSLGFNSSDSFAFQRALVRPKRGLGKKSLAEVRSIAVERGVSLFAALSEWLEHAKASRTKERLTAFVDVIGHIGSASDSAVAAANVVFSLSGLVEAYKEQEGIQDFELQSKQENLAELMRTIDEFDRISEDRSLAAYLSQVSLRQDQDGLRDNEHQGVSLITAHSAKGLEFDTVFIVGVEEGIFPHYRSIESKDSIQQVREERRLFYVACTRARTRLFISHCTKRKAFRHSDPLLDFSRSATDIQEPSRFLREMEDSVQQYDGAYAGGPYGVDVSDRPDFKSPEFELIDGQIVEHPVFGEGKVTEVYFDGDDQFVVVDFKKAGVKKLATKYAQLKKKV